ncbi:hypothetical protein AB0H71_04665 [Nocardia sp. NPDC050697]|uniref:hypothetical protein n=1 Tax=Nocardia sp. NPDC050697 TaxID=3155158 RepID=UPI0034036189
MRFRARPEPAPIPGLATVRAVRHTGVGVRGEPRLRLALTVEAGGRAFETETVLVVPLSELSLLRPGVVLPVRCTARRVELDLDRTERGIAAEAVVRWFAVPGEVRAGRPRVLLGLLVIRPDGSAFHTRTEQYLPATALGEVGVGRAVRVHYLPSAEREVVVSVLVSA